jgi:hypothetical protein
MFLLDDGRERPASAARGRAKGGILALKPTTASFARPRASLVAARRRSMTGWAPVGKALGKNESWAPAVLDRENTPAKVKNLLQ